jgi:hypothetical protein
MAAATKTDAERIVELEEKINDLADFVGRLTDATFGAGFRDYDRGEPCLTWEEYVSDEGTPDEDRIWWWTFESARQEEASDA